MKKALIVIALLLLITLPVSAQEYWNLKASVDGIAVMPADSNGMAFGGGVKVSFGEPDGSFDIGFEFAKWWRAFELYDSLANVYANIDDPTGNTITYDMLDRDQQALQFSVFARFKFLSLFNDGLDLYSGLGTGLYFLQERREEVRQNANTGIWEIVKVDNYLDTKGHVFTNAGFTMDLFSDFSCYLEYRLTYIHDYFRWDNQIAHCVGAGVKYEF